MSDPILLKKPLVGIDLAGCYADIAERRPDAAIRFRQAAEAAFATLAQMPGIVEPYPVANPRLAGLRCARVGRFKNYLIFYCAIPGGIDVIRILHGARGVREILEAEEAE